VDNNVPGPWQSSGFSIDPLLSGSRVYGTYHHHLLDDDWNEPEGGQKPGPKSSRPVRYTEFLPNDQAKELCIASLYADKIGCALGTHITMHLGMSSLFPRDDPRGQMALQGNLIEKTTKMLNREGMDQVAFIWVLEDAPKKGRHLHWQINTPYRLHSRLKEFLANAGCFSRNRWGMRGEAIRISGHRNMGAKKRAGTLVYALKGLQPTTELPGTDDGIFDPLGITTERSRPIFGKRCGTSQNIGRAARRKAGWRESMDWSEIDVELRAARLIGEVG
jgi:hypothetical protein